VNRRVALVHNTARYLAWHYGGLVAELVGRGEEVVCLVPPDGGAAQLRALGARVVDLRLSRRGLNPLAELATLLRIRRLVRRERPDTVLNFSIKPAIYGSLGARLAGVRRVCSMITGLGYAFMDASRGQRVLRRIVSALYRLALARNDCVFFQNPDDRDLFVRAGLVAAQRCRVLPGTGIDLEHFRPDGSPPAPATFLYVGRLLADKGVREFVEAARAVKREIPQARFQLLGPLDENPAALTREEVQSWAGEGVVEYLGESPDVRPHVAASTAVVLPSYREGLPRVLLEAMAMARPVVATDVPGCRTVVRDGRDGFLVPARDAGALAAAMARLAREPAFAAELGRQARESVAERFDVREVNRMILESLDAGAGTCC